MGTRCVASYLPLPSPFTSLEEAAERTEETDDIVFKNINETQAKVGFLERRAWSHVNMCL